LGSYNRAVTLAPRILRALLIVAVYAAPSAVWPTASVSRHDHASHGCEAAAPRAAAIEAVDAVDVVARARDAASAAGLPVRVRTSVHRAGRDAVAHSAFTFVRPYDPRHLHAFALLI
jgi:hypothetical protein